VKLHTLIDLRGNIPCFIRITHGKTADVKVLDHLPIEPGAFYMMDRGYIDFERLYAITRQLAFFVTRAKRNIDCSRRESRAVDKSTGLRSDQTIVLQCPKTAHLYPALLRRVAFYDDEHDRRLVFLTNNFELPALTIAQLYRCRWRVELFFKWIKQNLRIKTFYGHSVNAVKTQVWIAISVYVLVAILKRELKIDRSLTEILQILSVTPFEKTPIFQACSPISQPNSDTTCCNQLSLFDL
jgi:transposase